MRLQYLFHSGILHLSFKYVPISCFMDVFLEIAQIYIYTTIAVMALICLTNNTHTN